MSDKLELGYCNGETCNRHNDETGEICKGIIEEHYKDGGCSCHINPPCSYCETPSEYCPECDWDAREEKDEMDRIRHEVYLKQQEKNKNLPPPPPKVEIRDDGKLYSVVRYFDDIYEATIGSNLTIGEANDLQRKMNNKPRYYVYYSVREQKPLNTIKIAVICRYRVKYTDFLKRFNKNKEDYVWVSDLKSASGIRFKKYHITGRKLDHYYEWETMPIDLMGNAIAEYKREKKEREVTIEYIENSRVMSIQECLDELDEKRKILSWLIQGIGQTGLPLKAVRYLTIERICELYSVEPSYFDKL